MKVAIINRAVSGSGKSTMAREISRVLTKHQKICTIHSTDDYFLVNGEYKFDFTKLGENHAKNLEAFTNDLSQGLDCVICDNTNLRKQDVMQYAKVASDYGYMVYMLNFIPSDAQTHFERNAHGVPMDKIQIMIDLFNKNRSVDMVKLSNEWLADFIYPEEFGTALCEIPSIVLNMLNKVSQVFTYKVGDRVKRPIDFSAPADKTTYLYGTITRAYWFNPTFPEVYDIVLDDGLTQCGLFPKHLELC